MGAQEISMQQLATLCFLLAVLHTFFTRPLRDYAEKFAPGSFGENLFHLLGEVEVVFGLWSGIFLILWSLRFDSDSAARYLASVNFSEAGFVFVVMCMSATKPILSFADRLIAFGARLLPFSYGLSTYLSCLILGPLLGSLITEPAAMTVTAILLRERVLRPEMSQRFLYATLGLLFVNISIGGTLTHFAAPPVVMVAHAWDWDSLFLLSHFGWKALLSIVLTTLATGVFFRSELLPLTAPSRSEDTAAAPGWLIGSHFLFLALAIFHSHYLAFCLGLFFFFLGWCTATKEHQDELKIRESLLVGFFLAGLVTLGKLQEWWLQPLMSSLSSFQLFWGAAGLTAFTDNAALTYLGTLVPNLSDQLKYSLVAGAVTGGGLTVIANAPNPVGFSLLSPVFGHGGIRASGLFLGALFPTLVAAMFFLCF